MSVVMILQPPEKTQEKLADSVHDEMIEWIKDIAKPSKDTYAPGQLWR